MQRSKGAKNFINYTLPLCVFAWKKNTFTIV
jgi:hypothetical protein